MANMESHEHSSRFFSANQSPLDSPKSNIKMDSLDTYWGDADSESLTSVRLTLPDINPVAEASTSKKMDNNAPRFNDHSRHKGKAKKIGRLLEISATSASLYPNRLRSVDVYIGFHGRKPLLLRFTNWLRAELEVQGLSCFVTDRARCRNSRKHSVVEKAIDGCTFGVVILTKKSLRNPYTIEELKFFSSKKNLVPVYFDLGPEDCLVRDIVEKRGEIWEKYGGELWVLYGGVEKEWRDGVGALTSADEWKLEASDGRWRDCVMRAVTLLALRLGRRSVVDRLSKWSEKAEKEEFPYPRNEGFVGRKKELNELEFMLFGDVSGDAEKDYFQIKSRSKSEKRRKGKEPVVWKESEKEIEMEGVRKSSRRRRSTKIVYGKGIACVSGESGIGKTELLLEYAYRFHQRYKMVLWIGGESRYIRQNYLNLWSFLEIDVGVESSTEKGRTRTFEEQEEATIARVRKELMRNIPFLVIIDNLESEKDWWDHKLVMDLLPRFGGETHVIISTRLPRVMNLDPLKLSFLSGVEAMALMQLGLQKDQSVTEIDALRSIEEKLGRLTLGLAIIGSILSELPITPTRLLDTINRMPSRENHTLRRNTFLFQLLEVCFSIFDHADASGRLATRMVLASGWFGPAPIPVQLLASAAQKDHHAPRRLWGKITRSFVKYARKSETEASSLLVRFNLAKTCTKEGCVDFGHLIKLYARKRGAPDPSGMVRAVITARTGPAAHIWAACFLLLGFGKDPVVVEIKVSDLINFVKEVALPLAIKTFITFSRCGASLELLRLCTDALEAADVAFVTPVEKWLDRSMCWKTIQTKAQMNPYLWQELALTRATVLEVRAKLMGRGGQFDVGDDLIRKAIFIRTSICGEEHSLTVSAKETLAKLTRLSASVQNNPSL